MTLSKRQKRKIKKRICILTIVFSWLTILYLTIVFSDIPFIAKWRTLYIETAMTTNSHHWMAEWFFPDSVIDKVMADRRAALEAQRELQGDWEGVEQETKKEEEEKIKTPKDLFFEEYWELDSNSFNSLMDEHPELFSNGYNNILIENFNDEYDIETVKGDKILVVDTANNLLIIGVSGEGYVGKMAVAKNPEQVDLVTASTLGSYGEEAITFNERYDALITINASGFVDVGGHGSGGHVKGSVIRDGQEYGEPVDGTWKFFGFKKDNRMYINNYSSVDTSEYRWAMEFFPALIVNGENVVDGSFGMGIQPRSSVGQAQNGDFMMLVIDGRQIGYSLGTTVAECAKILERYNAYQAMNLDGGSSSVMIYKGTQINRSSSVSGRGRYMPDAFLINRP